MYTCNMIIITPLVLSHYQTSSKLRTGYLFYIVIIIITRKHVTVESPYARFKHPLKEHRTLKCMSGSARNA